MTSLLHFEEKVHCNCLARAEGFAVIDAEIAEPGPGASGVP